MKLILALIVGGAMLAQELPQAGEGIERVMRRAAKGGETLRVLFYGQSITKQAWWREVAEDLRQRFPQSKWVFENRAIGGYSTPRLIRTLEADVLPFHPDLIIFHDYGQQDLYEKIIRWMRANTTADLLLQSDHVTWTPGEDDPDGGRKNGFVFSEKHSFEWLPGLARKYGLGLVDIRGGWKRYLADKALKPKELLRDSVHLNEHGERLYAELTKAYLVAPPATAPAQQDYFRDFEMKGKKTLDFAGTRVEIWGAAGGPLDVYIDGKRPGEFPELHYHSRPTNTWGPDWPTLMRVERATVAAHPLIEEWTLKVTKKREVSGLKFDFELYGSRTGMDGAGSNDAEFQSASGRVKILPQDYDVERAYGLQKKEMPNDWQIRWTTLPMFVDPILPSKGPVTVLYGLKPGRHRLELKGKGGVEMVRVYRPPLSGN